MSGKSKLNNSNRAFLLKFYLIILFDTLKSAGVIYYESMLHATIWNARKNLLTIANAKPALLFSVLCYY